MILPRPFAENVAGSIPKFVKIMNENATKIGAEDSFFQSPRSADPINHFTTAYDLAPKLQTMVLTILSLVKLYRRGNIRLTF